ncbi:hypothetical protein QBC47DRAFT_389674 [Echria macrotheca]|uniref:Cns1/TTC4 wheel domain-containing protein n=1 Tax=Echria macrotheca TaxID=438768 RepID=A0AAJ0F8G6_9PEZI|nr:hypothetical protein QBC47DRAFT_389674 [Echria macrotheca]
MDNLTTQLNEMSLPPLPPGRAPRQGMTLEETVADLKQHPLFMTDLPSSGEEQDENPDLAALQALAYDGSPLENALNFKEQGNDSFRAKRWSDAKEFYSKGILLLVAEEKRRADGVKPDSLNNPQGDSEGEVAKQRGLLEVLYGNRAACHLELRNYRSCVGDCAAALRINPGNVKALYRSARALVAVDRLVEAEDACARGLALDPGNGGLKNLGAMIEKRKGEVEVLRKKEEEREAKVRRREVLLKTALRARGVRTRTTGKPPDMEDARVMLSPDPDEPTSTLVFPVLLLYPLHMETDFIKAFGEAECLDQHFGYVFPLPWDREGEYAADRVECFVESVAGGLVRVGRKVALLKVLGTGKVEVVDDLIKIFVVPKGKAEAWVKDYKEKRAGEKRS